MVQSCRMRCSSFYGKAPSPAWCVASQKLKTEGAVGGQQTAPHSEPGEHHMGEKRKSPLLNSGGSRKPYWAQTHRDVPLLRTGEHHGKPLSPETQVLFKTEAIQDNKGHPLLAPITKLTSAKQRSRMWHWGRRKSVDRDYFQGRDVYGALKPMEVETLRKTHWPTSLYPGHEGTLQDFSSVEVPKVTTTQLDFHIVRAQRRKVIIVYRKTTIYLCLKYPAYDACFSTKK